MSVTIPTIFKKHKLLVKISILLVASITFYLFMNIGIEGFESFKNSSFLTFIQDSLTITNKKVVIDNASINIPTDIYQTWHTKDLPPNMRKCVQQLKAQNPEFNFHLYDDNDCREFIKNNFQKDVLVAFDALIPGAYKADLWRYCVLYKKGGIYLDIKYQCANGFKFIQLADKEYFVLERPGFWKDEQFGIYNAFMISKQGNPILLDCIEQIVKNVKNNFYGFNSLYPTGPGLLGEQYFKDSTRTYYDFELFYHHPEKIIYKNIVILKGYPEYREEQKKTQKTSSYHDLWSNKQIYKIKKY